MAIFDSAGEFLKAGFEPRALLTGGLSAVPDQWRMLKSDFRGGGGNSSTPAGDAYAQLTRELWDQYVQSFMPYENKLIRFATDANAPLEAMQRASTMVGDSFDAQQGASERRLRGLGLQLDVDEQRAADRAYGMARSLADVSAQNNARDLTRARQASVLGNPVPQLPNI